MYHTTEMKCPVCGCTFIKNVEYKKYCSHQCCTRAKNAAQAKRRQEAREAKKKPSTLAEIARAANAAGMTYGKYVAKYAQSDRYTRRW